MTENAKKKRAEISEDVKTRAEELVNKYSCEYHKVIDTRRELVLKLLKNAHSFLTILFPKRIKKLYENLKNAPSYSNEEACRELIAYYNQNRDIVECAYRDAGLGGEFPDLPISYIKHNLTLFPLKSRDENKIRSIITDVWSKFHINNQAFEDYVVRQHFPELSDHPRVPSTFVETILDQSVELWGKSVRDVYFARKWLLLEVVLKETLDRLRDKVPCYGYSDWEHEIFVQQYMALREPVYRELSNLAMRVPERREMGERPLYSYEKLEELHKKILGKTSLEKWCNTFGVELARMREYFNTLIR